MVTMNCKHELLIEVMFEYRRYYHKHGDEAFQVFRCQTCDAQICMFAECESRKSENTG